MWRRRPTIVVDTYYNTISLDHSVEKRKFGFQKKFREIIATFFSVNLSNTFQSISRKFCKVVAFWNKSLMFPHCVDVSAVVFQSKCPKMSQLLHMTDQSITKLWLEPGSPKSFGKKHFHSKCYTYARRKGDDWKKKIAPLTIERKKFVIGDSSTPYFLSRRKEYLENQGGPVCHLCLVKQKRSNFHLILVNWNKSWYEILQGH